MNHPTTTPVTPASVLSSAQLAKAALRRLALEKLEPTPENFAHAYAQEGGGPRAKPEAAALPPEAGDAAPQLAVLIGRVVRGVERGSRGWTLARKKEGLQRVLEGSRSDMERLKQRLNQLLASWESDAAGALVDLDGAPSSGPGGLSIPADGAAAAPVVPAGAAAPANDATHAALWQPVLASLSAALACALPDVDPGCRRLNQALAKATQQVQTFGPAPGPVRDLAQVCDGVRFAVQQRARLAEQLARLCRELATGMAEFAENDSWVKGQCEAMHNVLEAGVTGRAVKAVNELLRDTRKRQGMLRAEREQARDALKTLVASMLGGLSELGSQTGRLHDNVNRYTEAIEQADTLAGLTSVVREMVDETRSVQGLVAQTRTHLEEEHAKASALSERVVQLEDELRRLSSEVTTDQLTQVANRRGLLKVFDVERARMQRSNLPLTVGLLDIDNFKRLNDELGHGVGDEALKALAANVSKALRATDLVARYGGEEFVVLLPETNVEQAQVLLTRLQRQLSSGLFLHEDKDVFVTFSAGVTLCGSSESIEDVLERADGALYEAKRAGKNRTCVA
ncbi:MAG: diguanylate cyclase [Burkholderiaceae bacterium]